MSQYNNLDLDKISRSFNHPKKPFRYTCIDNFLNAKVCQKFEKCYPESNDPKWYRFRDEIHGEENVFEKGMMGISNLTDMPKVASNVITALNSDHFIEILNQITGLSLVKDPHNDIGQWAGMRAMLPGGYQSIHSDARKHPHLGLEKRITLVGYLNKDWVPQHKGYTEIWNDTMSECVDRVAPLYNRILIFENTSTSYHGVPEVSNYRKSFLTSYLLDSDEFHETRPKARFMKRPNEKNIETWDKLSAIRENLNDY